MTFICQKMTRQFVKDVWSTLKNSEENMKPTIREIANRFCDEPYRLFFPLGAIFGIVGVSHWLFYAVGWIKTYSFFFHSSIQIMVYMTCFVTGFLLTAMPRFSATRHASRSEILLFLACIFSIFVFLTFGCWIAAELSFLAWMLTLGRFGVSRFIKKKESPGGPNSPPLEFIWIPIAILHGVAGVLILTLSQARLIPAYLSVVGKPMVEQGFLLSVVVGVGGFLIPRVMGTFKAVASKETCTLEEVTRERRQSISFHLIMGIVLFISFWLEGFGFQVFGYALRAVVVTGEFFHNGLLPRPPKVTDLFVRLVWLSVWMITLGYWLATFLPEYRVVTLHFVFIGGFSLMTFSIATMVVMSHAGEGEKLRGSPWILWVVVVGLALALLKRITAIFFPDVYFNFLGAAALFWVLADFSWLCFIAPRILKIPQADEFERLHEEAKRRLKEA